MRFKISISISLVCIMVMFFGAMVVSTDDGGKALMEKMFHQGKTATLYEDKHPEINELMTNFMNSRQEVNMQKLGECVDDISAYKEEELRQTTKLVERVDNIKCYTIDGWEKDTYVVFLYYEYKIQNVDSKIPNLVRDLVGKDKEGKLRVITRTREPKAIKLVQGTQSNEQVIELIKKVDDSIRELKEKDSSAKTFIVTLENAAKEKKAKEKKKQEDKKEKEDTDKQKNEAQQPSNDNGEQKQEEQKSEEQKPEEQKPEEQKQEEQKSEEQKPEEQKPEEQKAENN